MFVCIAALGGGAIAINNSKDSVIAVEAQLEKVVSVSKLSGAKFAYNGIAVKKDDKGREEYHVRYKSTVTASVSMTDIAFHGNEKTKKMTVSLPTPTIDSPVIDSSSLDFFESGADANLGEFITLCKDDALREIEADGDITRIATENLKKTVEALCKPILDETGYTLEYQEAE